MRKTKTTLKDVLDNKDIKWDGDSTNEVWNEFYKPFYSELLGDLVNLEKLDFVRGKNVYRVIAYTNNIVSGVGMKISFGGDVIINDPELDNKYKYDNLGLLPILGNLQAFKADKKAGADMWIDLLVKVLAEYYREKDVEVLKGYKGRRKIEQLGKALDYLGRDLNKDVQLKIGYSVNIKQPYPKEIYAFCYRIYGIDAAMTTKLLNFKKTNEGNGFDEIRTEFWEMRKKRFESIKNNQRENLSTTSR